MSSAARVAVTDQTLQLLWEGYGFLPNRRQAAGRDVVPLRVLGRRTVAACGPRWTEQFYDPALFTRSSAVPEPVRSTLFGHGGVQGLDGTDHAHRGHLGRMELLNILRPIVAITWWVTFAAHALRVWPRHRERLVFGSADDVSSFAQEVRRFYPFAPFLGALAREDLEWHGQPIRVGDLVLLDIFGQHHDHDLWNAPYTFDPDRFSGYDVGAYDLIPQGGGYPATGHRCPGEPITVAVLETVLPRLARLHYVVPEQDLRIRLARLPARPENGMILTSVRDD